MSLPAGPESTKSITTRWRVEGVHCDRAEVGLKVTVIDRLIRNGKLTDEYRTRELTEAEAEALRRSTAEKTYMDWQIMIHDNAE